MSKKKESRPVSTHEQESREDYVRRIVDAAPPFDEEQRARINDLMQPSFDTSAEDSGKIA